MRTFALVAACLAQAALAAVVVVAPQAPEPVDTNWSERSGAAGVLYAENFASYSSDSQVRAAAVGVSGNDGGAHVQLETVHGLSGKGLRITTTTDAGANPGTWQQYMNGSDDTEYSYFYLQLVIYNDGHFINYPFKQTDNSDTSPKFVIIDQYNSSANPGEVVVINRNNRGFVTIYGGQNTFDPMQLPVAGASTPCPSGDPDYRWQFEIDRGTPSTVSTCADYKRRYGPLNYNFSGSTTAGTLLDQQGTPDPDAAIGGVTWVKDGYTVVEVFVDVANDRVMMWAAELGAAPVLITDTSSLTGFDEFGDTAGQYNGFQLTTFRTSGKTSEPNRQETYTSYLEVIVSSEPIPFPNGGDTPHELPGAPGAQVASWFAALADGEWAAPVGNWLGAAGVKDPLADSTNSGNTGHESLITTWTGMGVDETRKTAFMLHNGGHSDYFGNEVYSVDLSQDSPVWIRRRNATPADGGGNLTAFSDGRPVSDHTSNLHVAAEGRWFTPGMASTNYSGFANYGHWWEYDPVADDYIDLGDEHEYGGLAVHGLALWDPADRQILVFIDNNNNPSVQFQDIDDMSGAPALVNTNGLNTAGYLMGAIDTTNRVVLVRSGSTYYYLRINNNTNKQAAWQSVSASGTAANDRYQFYWHAPSGAFITWDGSSGFRKLTPTVAGGGGYSSLTWSQVSGNGGTSPPTSGPGNGMFNKVNMIQDMGNGDAALIVVPRYANPDVYVARISGDGI